MSNTYFAKHPLEVRGETLYLPVTNIQYPEGYDELLARVWIADDSTVSMRALEAKGASHVETVTDAESLTFCRPVELRPGAEGRPPDQHLLPDGQLGRVVHGSRGGLLRRSPRQPGEVQAEEAQASQEASHSREKGSNAHEGT